MKTRNNPQVFLSYAQEDEQDVEKLHQDLTSRNVLCWFAKNDLKGGSWKPQLEQAIAESRYFILCLSQIALEKIANHNGHLDEEFRYAYQFAMTVSENQFMIIPVRLEDCDRGDHRLSGLHQYDLFDNREEVLKKLVDQCGVKQTPVRFTDQELTEGLFGKVVAKFYASEYEDALTFIEAILSFDYDNTNALTNKGVILASMREATAAISVFDSVLEKKPDHVPALVNKGIALFNSNRMEEAIVVFDKALQIDEGNSLAWMNKGDALASLNRFEEALKYYGRAISFDPANNRAKKHQSVAKRKLGREKKDGRKDEPPKQPGSRH